MTQDTFTGRKAGLTDMANVIANLAVKKEQDKREALFRLCSVIRQIEPPSTATTNEQWGAWA